MAWPWTMLLQWQRFCCGETRRRRLHISLLWSCCFTGFSFLEELSCHLLPSFCCWLMLSFLDMVFYHQKCKYWCSWRLNWITVFTRFCKHCLPTTTPLLLRSSTPPEPSIFGTCRCSFLILVFVFWAIFYMAKPSWSISLIIIPFQTELVSLSREYLPRVLRSQKWRWKIQLQPWHVFGTMGSDIYDHWL